MPVIEGRWRRLVRRAPWIWALALALLVSRLVTVEWSQPICNAPVDGGVYAAYGFPLPYTDFSGFSSLTYGVMPHVFLFDLTFAVLLLLPAVKAVLGLSGPGRVRGALTRPAGRGRLRKAGVLAAPNARIRELPTGPWVGVGAAIRALEVFLTKRASRWFPGVEPPIGLTYCSL